MSKPITFWAYCTRLWEFLPVQAKHWARDQIIWPFVMTVFLTTVVAIHDDKKIDWQVFRAGLLLYVVVFFTFGLSQFIRAGWHAYRQKDHDYTLLHGALEDRKQLLIQAQLEVQRARSDTIHEIQICEHLEEKLEESEQQLIAANENIERKTNEIALLKQIPANIGVEILELQRRAIDSQQEGVRSWKYDIFVRAKLELRNVDSVAISQMRVEMSLQGALETPAEKKDIESWRLYISRKIDGGVGYAYHRIKPLKEELTRGVPEEGWLHYVTNRTTDEELDGSSLKLIVETPRGTSHTELDAHTNKWSPWGSGRIVPDPDTTNIGLPNIGE